LANLATTSALKSAKWAAFTNGKYHADREAILTFWDRLITFMLLCAGAGTIVELAPTYTRPFSALVVTVFATIQLVYDITRKSQKHGYLRDRYFKLASDLERGSLTPKEAHAQMLELAGSEDPIYCVVQQLSEQWAHQAVYGKQHQDHKTIGFWRRMTKHVFRQADL
jgi:hypothetical protein